MKIKIIDLLNLVYENKAPKKILYKYCEYEFCIENNNYRNKDGLNLFEWLFSYEVEALNFEVEVIEEQPKKIEKFIKTDVIYEDSSTMPSYICKQKYDYTSEEIFEKLNEVIDNLNYLLEKSDSE